VLAHRADAAEPIRGAPFYTSESIVNAATNLPGPLAPLALVSMYGKDLAFVTRALTPDDLRGGYLPTTLIGSGVSITIDNIAVPVLFVSPTQVNFLIPGNIIPGRRSIRLSLNGRLGPDVAVQLAEASPGLFALEDAIAIATHADGSLVNRTSPAVPEEVVVVYAAGLGVTQPTVNGLAVPSSAATISARSKFEVLLNGEPIPDDHILYAGITPGFAGLYQVNCRIPRSAPADPEIRFRIMNQISPSSVRMPLRAELRY
jgi:uncharacterized protein (TIGR03437 family)